MWIYQVLCARDQKREELKKIEQEFREASRIARNAKKWLRKKQR